MLFVVITHFFRTSTPVMGVEVRLKHRFWTSAGSCATTTKDTAIFRSVVEFPEVLGYLHTGNTRSAVRYRNPVRPEPERT